MVLGMGEIVPNTHTHRVTGSVLLLMGYVCVHFISCKSLAYSLGLRITINIGSCPCSHVYWSP